MMAGMGITRNKPNIDIGLYKMNANRTAEVAPEAPSAMYEELFLYLENVGIFATTIAIK